MTPWKKYSATQYSLNREYADSSEFNVIGLAYVGYDGYYPDALSTYTELNDVGYLINLKGSKIGLPNKWSE